jgi:AraC family transcriptional regulator of arabinose operon
MDQPANRMDYPAIMSASRQITASTPARPIKCSEFRKGRGYVNWRPKGSGDWLLILTQGGAGRVHLPNKNVQVVSREAVLYAPGAEQDYATDGSVGYWHLRWAHFQPRPHWLPWLIWPEIAARVGHVQIRGVAVEMVDIAFTRMLTVSQLGEDHWGHFAMNALEEALLWIFRMNADDSDSSVDSRIQRAMHYLASRLNEPFELSDVATYCGLSPSRFSHLFRDELGITPQQFSEKLKLESARQLLAQTNLSISEVAGEVGFIDPYYFSRRFRRFFGHPPMSERTPE